MKKLSFLLLICAIQPSLKAQPGSLDPTFGNGGIVKVYKEFRNETALDMAVGKDGKILIMTGNINGKFFKRFLSDGTPDSSFGEAGVLEINLYGGDVNPFTFTIDSSNRIVLVGWEDDMVVVRLLEDGVVDNSFSANGYQQTKLDNMADAILIQSDGKVVIAGQFGENAAIRRYNDDGSKDATFNSTGAINVEDLQRSFAFGLAQQSDGKIIITGSSNNDLFVARLNTNGTLDNSFADVGYKIVEGEDAAAGQDASVLPDGKIIISGYSKNSLNSKMTCWRFLPDGSFDESFATSGIATLYSAPRKNYGWSVFSETDTSAVVVGSEFSGGDDYTPVLFHVLNDGSEDSNFGENGSAKPGYELVNTIKVTAAKTLEGKILVCGAKFNNGDNQVHLSQFNVDGSPDSNFGNSGNAIVATDTFYNYFGLNPARSVLPNNNLLCSVTPSGNLCLFQLTNDGSIDSSYGEGGFYVLNNHMTPFNVCTSSNANYIYLGETQGAWYDFEDLFSDSTPYKIRIYRFNNQGIPDSSYGGVGVVEPLFPNDYVGKCSNIAIQPDGKQLVSGIGWRETYNSGYSLKSPFLFRLKVDGSVDSSFGENGIHFFDWAVGEYSYVTIRDDGKIIFESLYYDSTIAFTTTGITLLNTDGSVDNTWGNNGFIEFAQQATSGNGCWWIDGRLVSLLVNWYPFPVIYNLLGQNENGSIDSSFGTDGLASLSIDYSNYFGLGLASLSDGKIVTLGTSVMKLNQNGSIDSTFGLNGISSVAMYGSGEKILVDNNSKIVVSGFSVPYFSAWRLQNDVATSIAFNQPESDLKIYPNPTSDQIIIRYPFSLNEEATIIITDVTGKILHEEKVNESSDHYLVSLNDFPSGIYFLTVKTNSNAQSAKVIKE